MFIGNVSSRLGQNNNKILLRENDNICRNIGIFNANQNFSTNNLSSMFDTSEVTKFAYAFLDWENLISLDLIMWKINKLTDMRNMFNSFCFPSSNFSSIP